MGNDTSYCQLILYESASVRYCIFGCDISLNWSCKTVIAMVAMKYKSWIKDVI